jgi:hypothetical protein
LTEFNKMKAKQEVSSCKISGYRHVFWGLRSPEMLCGVYWYLVTEFRDELSVPPSNARQPKKNSQRRVWLLKIEPRDFPETSVTSYQPTLLNIP